MSSYRSLCVLMGLYGSLCVHIRSYRSLWVLIHLYVFMGRLNPYQFLSEVESSRTSLASRTSSRTHFEVLGLGLGLEGQVLGLGLETSSPQKLACPRLEDSTIF